MTTHENDRNLVRAVIDGSAGATGAFIERMRCIPRILASLNRRLGGMFSRDELADICQETYARVWSRLASFTGAGCLEAWVYRFCYHVMWTWRQRKSRELRVVHTLKIEAPQDAEGEVSLADRQVLYDAMNALPEDQRSVIDLKNVEGLSFTEIGLRLKISPNSAKTRYYRGLDRLRDHLLPLFREGSA